jgi:hypothetical protein
MRGWRAMLAAMLLMSAPAEAQQPPQVDVHALFDQDERDARVGLARKTMQVDARPARPGEVVVTLIAGEGQETQSPPAKPGDMVVRNRCPETGNEEILVEAAKFLQRYDGPEGPADAAGWQTYRPRGNEMRYLIVREADGAFTFTAPWASRWSRGLAMRSCATRRMPPTPTVSLPPPSPAPTRSYSRPAERRAAQR